MLLGEIVTTSRCECYGGRAHRGLCIILDSLFSSFVSLVPCIRVDVDLRDWQQDDGRSATTIAGGKCNISYLTLIQNVAQFVPSYF